MCHTAICAIVKNECFFLKEWIYYHYMIGFEKFILYNNESDDHIHTLLSGLISSNIVDLYDIAGNHIQERAYTRCLETYRNAIDWIAFIDIDEFIVIKNCLDIRLFLADYTEYAGLSMHWRMFGSNGRTSRPSGPVVESYTSHLYNNPGKFQVKSIVRPELVATVLNPHIFGFLEGHHGVDENHFPVNTPQSPYTAEKIYVNHYFYKSQQDYEEKIAKREQNPRYPQRSLDEFYAHLHEDQVLEIFPQNHIKMLHICLMHDNTYRYFDIQCEIVRAYEFHIFSDAITAYIKNKKISEAKIALSATYKKFKTLHEYIQLAIIVHMEDGNFSKAEKFSLHLIQKNPSLQNYYTLYMVYNYFNNADMAERIKAFLKHALHLYPNEEQELYEKIRKL